MYDLFPEELKQHTQWVTWKFEDKGGKKPTKVLHNARGGTAKSNDPATWTTFDEVYAVMDRFDGVGYVFAAGMGVVGIDLDDCVSWSVDEGTGEMVYQITELAIGIVQMIDSYTEFSPSRSGLHIYARGLLPDQRRKRRDDINVECYDSRQFFTVTGDHLPGTPLEVEDRQEELLQFIATYMAKKQAVVSQAGGSDFSDEQIIQLCEGAKNGPKFNALFHRGDLSGYITNGKPNHSSADQALCNILAYWTRDAAQIERLFNRSALSRDKWNSRSDYRDGTISNALSFTPYHKDVEADRAELRAKAPPVQRARVTSDGAVAEVESAPTAPPALRLLGKPEPIDQGALLDRIALIEQAVDMYDLVDELAQLSDRDYGKIKATLREKFGKNFRAQEFDRAVKEARGARVEEGGPQEWLVINRPGQADHGMWMNGQHALKEALEPVELLTAEGMAVGLTVKITYSTDKTATAYIPVEAVISTDPAKIIHEATRLAWTPMEARSCQTWLSHAINRMKIPQIEGMYRPCWSDDRLILPGGTTRLVPTSGATFLSEYGRARGGEEEARTAWQRVVALAYEWPRLGTILGAAISSVYLEQIDRPSFMLHITGESTKGKTTAAMTAMAAFGDPEKLLQTWNSTKNAIAGKLSAAAILPVLFDETASAGVHEDVLSAIVFDVSTGTSRSRLNQNLTFRETQHWHNVMISTGERRLTTTSGLTGIMSRVLEVPAPITSGAGVSMEAFNLANDHYGWPSRWLAEDPRLAEFRAEFADLESALAKAAVGDVAKRLSRNLAASAAGLHMLAKLAGQEENYSLPTTQELAMYILDDIDQAFQEHGVGADERLQEAVFEAANRFPHKFPKAGEAVAQAQSYSGYDGFYTTLQGREALCVFPSALKVIAQSIGLPDCDAALKGLRAKDELIVGSDGKMARSVWWQAKTCRVYAFVELKIPPEEEN